MQMNITETARVIRSKNAGPFELTLDIIFKSEYWYKYFKNNNIINTKVISSLYGVNESDILGIIWFEPANAVKATMVRRISSGAAGETDIYGAQQHAPLLGITFDYSE
ncbi:MAG: DUF4387 domain-containing protein [Deltaproteobacteria bacterium]|nr:DUF4387 domain-containing protein [Deltaproteobacteria bacterium]